MLTKNFSFKDFKKQKKSKKLVKYLDEIISSNNDWVVPAGAEERRFCVIEPGDSMMQNSNYFKSINEGLNNGGYEAMLYDLQNIING